jgi:hypothetical protein
MNAERKSARTAKRDLSQNTDRPNKFAVVELVPPATISPELFGFVRTVEQSLERITCDTETNMAVQPTENGVRRSFNAITILAENAGARAAGYRRTT